MLTKYHIVYESLESKVFYPGQLIMSVHPRSPLCTEYLDYYKDGTSKFRREIDLKIMKQMGENAPNLQIVPGQQSIYQKFIFELNQGKKSNQLENMK